MSSLAPPDRAHVARKRTAAVVALSMLALPQHTACARGDAPAKTDAAPQPLATPSSVAPAASPSVLAPIPLPAARPRMASVDAGPSSEWAWRTYRGDGFTVLFPGDPRVTELPADEEKVGYSEAAFDLPSGQASFAAGFSDHPAEDVAKPEVFLDNHLNAPRRGTTEVLHRRSIALAGHPGRVVILRRNISGTPLRVYSRIYLVGRRLYSLIVSTLDVGGIGEDIVRKFMESFRLG